MYATYDAKAPGTVCCIAEGGRVLRLRSGQDTGLSRRADHISSIEIIATP
jgi:hypothetical protein